MQATGDASALIALAVGDCLSLLDALFEEVAVPPAVFAEVAVPGRPGADVLTEYLRDKVRPVKPRQFGVAAAGLEHGELEAIAFTIEIGADVLLVDDARARRAARLFGVRVSGSIGVLLEAKQRGLIDAVAPRLERIRTAGIHYSDALVAEGLRLAGES